jgi:hypothetical protein
MRSLILLRIGWALAVYAFVDIVCTGMGMGVPIFCIFLGLPVRWYVARRITASPLSTRETLRRMLLGAGLTSAFTVVLMALVWASSLAMLFDPTADLANYGIPLILYEPLPSFIGWLVLMILISPVLQFLLTLFGALLTWLWELSSG